jgi:hypothetical protein
MKKSILNYDEKSTTKLLIQNRFLKRGKQIDERNTVSYSIFSVRIRGLNRSRLIKSEQWNLANINLNRSKKITFGVLNPEENLIIPLSPGLYVIYFYRLDRTYYKKLTMTTEKKIFLSAGLKAELKLFGNDTINELAWIKRK